MKEVKTFIPFPLYAYRVYVIFTDSLTESADSLVKQGRLKSPHGIDDTTDGFHVRMPNQSYSFIVLKYGATLNHIVHETYHSISTMFDWISARHEEEIFAYHLAYTVQVIANEQKKIQIKLDKLKQV
jgi:hypothetical protein